MSQEFHNVCRHTLGSHPITRRLTFGVWCLFLVSIVNARESYAMSYQVMATGGLMVQPASSYYLLVYGGVAEVSTSDQDIFFRAGYVERPMFRAAGFSDQEFCGFGLIGTKVWKSTNSGLFAAIGFGNVTGIVAKDTAGQSLEEKRRYQISGPALSLSYRWWFKKFTAALTQQSVIGFSEKAQTDAFVAWPYNFVLVDLGWTI